MRHLGSIVLSLLFAPIVYALTGIGLVKLSGLPRHLSTSDYTTVGIGVGAVLGAGLVYAVLVMARLSPLGPVLAGLAFLAVAAWYIGSRSTFTDTIGSNALGVRGAAWAPAGAVTALLAVPLLATIVSPRRWRRWANPPAAAAAPGYTPPVSPGDTPSYPGAPYPGAPSYPSTSAYPGSPAYSTAPAQAESSEATTVLPSSGPPAATPSAWPVREDPESTRKLP